jgi:hypothetical protein
MRREAVVKNKKNSLVIRILFFITVLAVVSFSCGNVPGNSPSGDEIATSEGTVPSEPASGGTVIPGPEGVTLNVDEGALSDESEVMMEVLPPVELPWEETPFEPDGPQYRLLLGAGRQMGSITMTIPLPDLPDPSLRYVYAAWVQPDQGEPSLVGALVREKQVTFPVIGDGKYQLIRILHFAEIAKLLNEKEPLSVPSYPQMTPAWCSPTAMTNLAGYHQGAWPVGGYGGKWGESSNWFLAGKADLPFNSGLFFHWTLEAGGYNVPTDVRQSFIDGNAIVLIWNWKAYQIEQYWLDNLPFFKKNLYLNYKKEHAEELFTVFRSFVEWNVWGGVEYQRPVAWGSSLAGHSRTITGSDGTSMYYNNPGSGSWNQTKTWEAYHQEIMISLFAEKTEIIDTVIFIAEPRPADQRRAVLWLLPWTENNEGSIVLRQGPEGTPAAYWRWDGTDNRDYGYYYQDLTGGLPTDPVFDVAFRAVTYQDVIEYGYAVRSISDGDYDYSVLPELFGQNGKVDVGLHGQATSVPSGQRADHFHAGSFQIATLEPGLYQLKFTLFQGNIVQDVKYVYFRVEPHGPLPFPSFEVKAPAFCREGPGSIYPVVTGFEARQELGLVGINLERTWGKFEATSGAFTFQCWVSLDMMDIPDGLEAQIIEFQPIPTVGPTATYCSQFTTPQTCATHVECTWDRLVGAGYCKAK